MSPRYRNSSGEKKVVGGPGLKSTQLHTPEFGRGLAAWWMAHGPVSSGTGGGVKYVNVTKSYFALES